MRIPSQADLLALYDCGSSLHPLDQALMLVQTAFPEAGDGVADWPLGKQNRALAELQCALFGQNIRGWSRCVACAEQLEFELDAERLAAQPAANPDRTIDIEGFVFRLPTSRDLVSILDEPDPDAGARSLLSRCLLHGAPGHLWTDVELESAGAVMAAADPVAEILLSFECPACGSHFSENLDLGAFLWSSVAASARQVLQVVHELASAYGWSEASILAMSTARRQTYLEMVRA